MKITILCSLEYPGIGASCRRIANYAKALKSQSVDVEIVSIPPKLKNVLLSVAQPIQTLIDLLRTRPTADVYFVYGFGWLENLFICLYAKRRRAKVVFEVNEKPYSIRGSGRRDVVLRYFVPLNLFLLTRLVYPMADGFVVISEKLKDFVSKYASLESSTIKIPILVDCAFFQGTSSVEIDVHHPYMIHTARLHDLKDGIVDVFRALVLVHKNYGIPLHFYLSTRMGLPSLTGAIDRIVEECDLTSFVHYLDDPDDATLLAYQQHCDLVVINKMRTEQNMYNFATKLGEYLAMGKPIITTPVGEAAKYLQDNVHCFYVRDTGPDAIAKSIVDVLQDKEACKRMGKAAHKLAREQFDYGSNAQRIADYFVLLRDTNGKGRDV